MSALTALKLAEIIELSGLPAGVVNIVTGFGDTGAAFVEHPEVNKVAFTGSTAVGKHIQRAVAGTDKKVTLELGGKSSNIIFFRYAFSFFILKSIIFLVLCIFLVFLL